MGQSVTPTAPAPCQTMSMDCLWRCLARMGAATRVTARETSRRHFLDIVLPAGPRRCYNVAVPGAAPADARGEGGRGGAHMRPIAVLVALVVLAGPAPAPAQGDPSITSAEPFKLGTFEIDGEPAHRHRAAGQAGRRARGREPALQRDPAYPPSRCRPTMVDLIGRYEYGHEDPPLRDRQRPRRAASGSTGDAAAALRPRREPGRTSWRRSCPGKMLNAAVNFYSHVGETGTAEEQKKAEAERRAKRGVPYLFLKPTAAR